MATTAPDSGYLPSKRTSLRGGFSGAAMSARIRLRIPRSRQISTRTLAPNSRVATRPWLVSAALLLLIATSGVGLWIGEERGRTEWDIEKAALLLRLDSVLTEGAAVEALFEGQVSGLADSLRRSGMTVSALVEELETVFRNSDVEADVGRGDALQRQLEEALAALAELRLAAGVDWSPIRERATAALARVFVERESGATESGTAFSVGGDGTMVTSAHLVVGPDGTDPPRQIAVQLKITGFICALASFSSS